MESTASPASWVYLGGWTQWGEGPVRGARITLSDAGGAYLIAFLALFVRLAGQHSWGIVRFLAFNLRRRGLDLNNNPFNAASQSILRNTDIDNAAIWQFFKLARHAEVRSTCASGRYISWILFAFVHTIAFLVAGIFVSKVAVSGSSEVLVRGPTCGLWQAPFAFGNYNTGSRADSIENNLYSTWLTHNTLRASQFAQQCYNTTSSDSALANCNAYAPSLVNWHTEVLTDCPFERQICANGTAVRFDSGLLDSLTHFGINAKASDRIKYRRVVECSPLSRNGYVSEIVNTSQVEWSQNPSLTGLPPSDGQFQEYQYGPNFEYNMTSTYIWNNFSLGTPAWVNTAQSTYGLFVALHMPDSPRSSTFTPVPELNRTDADVILYFLTTDVLYLSEVNDPWFQATTVVESSSTVEIGNEASSFDIYGPDNTAGVVACAQQFQYCNHDASRCSPLAGEGFGGNLESSIGAFSDGLELNPRQMSTFSRILQASANGDMWYVTFSGGGANLLAATIAATTWALPSLPDNQWILEFQHYFLMGLTHMQMELAAYATGPAGQNNYQYLTKPTTEEEWMCSNQIVQRSGYMTFSVLGIVLVLVIGGVMVLGNMCLPSITNYFRTRSFYDKSSLWYQFHHLSLLLPNQIEDAAGDREIKNEINHTDALSTSHDVDTADAPDNPLVFTTGGKSFWRISEDNTNGLAGQPQPRRDYIQ